MEPIKPSEVETHKQKVFPDIVIKTWNDLIASRFSNGSARINKNDVQYALKKLENYSPDWLNIEGLYRKAGWKVVYTSPDYTESFNPYYTFRT